jgi:hypothetical protein
LIVDNNQNNCSFGFAATQNAITTAFLYDTIPFMNTMERMMNPCFQNTEFASVMKGKDVMNDSDESAHVGESGGP